MQRDSANIAALCETSTATTFPRCHTHQVSLNGSAFNLDGSVAARVSAAGSNRAALRNGVAAFKGIRVQARDEGEYKLTIGSHSKKVAIQEAAVIVKVCALSVCCQNMRIV